MILYGFHFNKGIFTEWDVNITYEAIDDYRRYKVYTCKLIRKIAEDQAAENNIDPEKDLNWHLNNRINKFSFKEVEWTAIDVFRFGKYAYQKIDAVRDLGYTCWYFTQDIPEDHKKYVEDFLYNNWCDIRINAYGEKYAITPDRVKKEEAIQKKQNKTLDKAKNMDRVYLNITHNPNEDGTIVIDGVTYKFPKVKEFYYDGIFYYLPVKNGKAKRIKNKMIEAVLIDIDNEVYISNFEICK